MAEYIPEGTPGNALGLPGGPAFPVSIPGVGDNGCPGMSLRDWFAGMAMQAIFGAHMSDHAEWAIQVAANAYEMADAMLAQRSSANG